MQKTIRSKLYDTSTAELVNARACGTFGDPAGYEERLYRTPDGFYFLYGVGGETSPYTAETIRAVSKGRADTMQESWM